jgi:KRAB domain-containing zinc finger protein
MNFFPLGDFIFRKKRRKNVGFNCDLCRKVFSSKQSLSNHLLLHNDERRFGCDVCDKKFVSSGALHNHKK